MRAFSIEGHQERKAETQPLSNLRPFVCVVCLCLVLQTVFQFISLFRRGQSTAVPSAGPQKALLDNIDDINHPGYEDPHKEPRHPGGSPHYPSPQPHRPPHEGEDFFEALQKDYNPHRSGFLTLWVSASNPQSMVMEFAIDDLRPEVPLCIGIGAIFMSGEWAHMDATVRDDTAFDLQLAADGKSVEVRRHLSVLIGVKADSERLAEDLRLPGIISRLNIMAKRKDKKQGGALTHVLVQAGTLLPAGAFVAEPPGGEARLEVSTVRAFPENVDFTGIYSAMDVSHMSVFDQHYLRGWNSRQQVIRYCMFRLPKPLLPPRLADDRVGYFHSVYQLMGDYRNDGWKGYRPEELVDPTVRLIQRQRLGLGMDGKPELCYYIDPSVPKALRAATKKGVELWQDAFRELDMGPVIRALAPGDPGWPDDYDSADVRFNSISWAPGDRMHVFAIGQSVVDPRTGEILKANIVFTQGWVAAWIGEHALHEALQRQWTVSAVGTSGHADPLLASGSSPDNDEEGFLHQPDAGVDMKSELSWGISSGRWRPPPSRISQSPVEEAAAGWLRGVPELGSRQLPLPVPSAELAAGRRLDISMADGDLEALGAALDLPLLGVVFKEESHNSGLAATAAAKGEATSGVVSGLSVLQQQPPRWWPRGGQRALPCRSHGPGLLHRHPEESLMCRALRDHSPHLWHIAGEHSAEDLSEFLEAGIVELTVHEVGHTLGLRHNFQGSLGVSFEEAQDPAHVKKHGLTASVMDYLPVNHISKSGRKSLVELYFSKDPGQAPYFTPVIGAYDKFAIKYGYMALEQETCCSRRDELETVTNMYGHYGGRDFSFATDEDAHWAEDPYTVLYDHTKEPVRWHADQLVLVREVQATLAARLVLNGESYGRVARDQLRLLQGVLRTGANIARFVGGRKVSRYHKPLGGAPQPLEAVAKEVQALAVAQLTDTIFMPTVTHDSVFPEKILQSFATWPIGMYGKLPIDLTEWVSMVKRLLLVGLLRPDRLRTLFVAGNLTELLKVLSSKLLQFETAGLQVENFQGTNESVNWPVQLDYVQLLAWLAQYADNQVSVTVLGEVMNLYAAIEYMQNNAEAQTAPGQRRAFLVRMKKELARALPRPVGL